MSLKEMENAFSFQHLPGLDPLPPRPLPDALSLDVPPKFELLFALLFALVPLPALLLLLS